MNSKGFAVITGASQGIGACIAKGLAEDGYGVILIARSLSKLRTVEKEIREKRADAEVILIDSDIADYRLTNDGIKNAIIKKGDKKIDILVNSAGMWLAGSLEEPIDDFKRMLDVNLVSQYAILQQIVEVMKNQGEGYIFNVSSRAGVYGFANGGAYGATKFGFAGLSDSLYRELSPLGIKVTALCPGWVNTSMAKEAGTPLSDQEMIQPGDLLNCIRFLLSNSKSTCIREIVFECSKSII